MDRKFTRFFAVLLALLMLMPLSVYATGDGDGGESEGAVEVEEGAEEGTAPEEEGESGSNEGESGGEEVPDQIPEETEDPEAGSEEEPVEDTEEDPPVEETPEEETPEEGPTEEEIPEEVDPTEGIPEEEAPAGLGGRLMRIGIYYGSAGKQSVTLEITTGDGFLFGYYEGTKEDTFVALDRAEVTKVTVSAKNGIMTVKNTAGDVLYTHDQSQNDTGLGIKPYSLDGTKTVTKCGYPYYGSFRFECFSAYDGLMTIVNIVYLDDYVKGVVPYEMSASWHVEALKVQAVCARSYALSHLSAKHQRNFGFDLCDGDCCQVYQGVYSKTYADRVIEAVEGTAGEVLMYDGAYCDTVYSSSNGGGSESAKNVWGKDVPYLQGVIDPFEALIADKISNYYWSQTFTGKELQEKLVASGRVSCGEIVEVKATTSDTGNVIALTFVDDNDKSWTIYNTDGSGSKCRTFLSLRSIHYTVTSESGSETLPNGVLYTESGEELSLSDGIFVITGDGTITAITVGAILTDEGIIELEAGESDVTQATGDTFTFSGSGWGHNAGMSQYGSYAMAQEGYTYDEILEFYYTGAVLTNAEDI